MTQRSFTRVLLYTLIVMIAVVYIAPFVIQVATSVKTNPDATSNPLSLWPNPFSTEAFKTMFGYGDNDYVNFPLWFTNSTVVAVFVTVGRVFFDSLAGYALSRLQFVGRRFLFLAVLAVMSVPGVVLLIPKFLVLQYTGLYNTYGGMILPLIVDAAGIFIMKQFFDTIPYSIEEAARIDGAGVFRTFWSVVLPMTKPALLTLTILSFQGSWNEFTHMLVATEGPEHQTLTTGMAGLFSGAVGSAQQFPLKLAVAMVATIPVAIVFFVFQRRFVAGANAGSVKG
jgi:multiple sugar transport system permease protein